VKYTMRQILTLFAFLIVAGCAATPGKVAQTQPVDELNLQHGTALKGYDPVAYFAAGQPTAINGRVPRGCSRPPSTVPPSLRIRRTTHLNSEDTALSPSREARPRTLILINGLSWTASCTSTTMPSPRSSGIRIARQTLWLGILTGL
jgi:hypothetical protein